MKQNVDFVPQVYPHSPLRYVRQVSAHILVTNAGFKQCQTPGELITRPDSKIFQTMDDY